MLMPNNDLLAGFATGFVGGAIRGIVSGYKFIDNIICVGVAIAVCVVLYPYLHILAVKWFPTKEEAEAVLPAISGLVGIFAKDAILYIITNRVNIAKWILKKIGILT